MDLICVFKLYEKHVHRPFPIQGRASGTLAYAHYNEKYAGHTFEMPLSKARLLGPDMLFRFDMPLSKFYLCDVIVPEGFRVVPVLPIVTQIAKPVEKMTFKELYARVKELELPTPAMLARSGRKQPLIDAIREHEKASATCNHSRNQAPAPASEAAAA